MFEKVKEMFGLRSVQAAAPAVELGTVDAPRGKVRSVNERDEANRLRKQRRKAYARRKAAKAARKANRK